MGYIGSGGVSGVSGEVSLARDFSRRLFHCTDLLRLSRRYITFSNKGTKTKLARGLPRLLMSSAMNVNIPILYFLSGLILF